MDIELFCKRISEAIKGSGYTQKKIAGILNIREGNISNWKKGKNLPSVEILYKLCLILDESADYLLGIDKKHEDKKINNSFNNFSGNGNNIKL